MTKSRMTSLFVLSCCLVAALDSSPVRADGPASRPYFCDPAISPDRSEIAFVSGGDIWTVPAGGGIARLLVSNPATESRPIYSPDGRKLAFVSTRSGNGDIYVLTFESGEIRRLTFDDGFDQLDAWSRDGRWIYFSSTTRDISGMNDVFHVSADGGTPMQVSADRYANEYFSEPSPDGVTLAFTARGLASSQWWRKGHSHIDESEIWLRREGTPARYEAVTHGGAKEMWPMWSGDGKALYFVSDRSGAQNIWRTSIGGQPRQVTQFKDGRVLWPVISYDGRVIVFEHNFSIWKVDTETEQTSEVAITLRGAAAGPGVEHLSLTSQIQELALSPDGKKAAFGVRGEIFAASTKDGGTAARVTTTIGKESQIAWAPDSRRIAYTSDRDGASHLFLYDFSNSRESRMTQGETSDDTPLFSPDGKLLAFQRDGRELCVLDLDSKQLRVVARGYFARQPLGSDRPFVWSPDGRWIAYQSAAAKGFTHISVVPSAGGDSKPVSFLANSDSNTVSWSTDGTYLLFDTGQRTEISQLARVDLIPRAPKFREDLFRDLFKEETSQTPAQQSRKPENAPATSGTSPEQAPASGAEKKPAVKPVEIIFENVQRRLSLLPVGVDVNSQSISTDGKWVLMNASAAGQQNLYVYSLDELSREPAVARQLTSTPGFKSDAQFSPDGKDVYYLEQGRINVVTVESRAVRSLPVTAEMDVDFNAEKTAVFRQAWTYTRDNFFDPKFNGVDWQAVRERYAPLIAGARTSDEMRRLMNLMVGELNASHSGVSAPFGSAQPSTGRLGLRFDRGEYESSSRLRVTEVIALGPAALAGIKLGEYLLAVDGSTIDSRTNLDQLLDHTIGKRILLTVAAQASGADKREVAVQPVNAAAEKGLLYRAWVQSRREYVERLSGSKLGYVHMPDMGAGSLAQLYVDLDVENQSRQGVVVDIRNNNGGFVNAYALDVLTRRPYLTMTVRGFPPAPARPALGQRALELPTILVTNQHSLSDAEDFTEGYRTLRLGKVVGEPTAGWIIYTSSVQLIDGSSYRLPFIRITGADGTDMEMHPRLVDVPLKRPIGESYTDRDSQLDGAVRELLKQIGSK